jgi:hypothetical protein
MECLHGLTGGAKVGLWFTNNITFAVYSKLFIGGM